MEHVLLVSRDAGNDARAEIDTRRLLQREDSQVGSALRSLRAGSRVGLSLDSDHHLHLHVDGQHRGIVTRDVTQPCYALFDICGYVTQVRLALFILLMARVL